MDIKELIEEIENAIDLIEKEKPTLAQVHLAGTVFKLETFREVEATTDPPAVGHGSKPSCLNCKYWDKVEIDGVFGLCDCENTQDALGASPIETKHNFSCKYAELFK